MTRRRRNDTEGSWHHVMNRAVARRSLFETGPDIRFFLAGVAKAVRRGQLEVHAWSVLTTHFHMLVRSPIGELSDAMRRIQNAYARNFNRKLRRDGPLHRGRFTSKPVDSLTYRKALVRYIDDNPVAAGLCASAEQHPWGSARSYTQSSGPPWLRRDWVENWMMEKSGTKSYEPGTYPQSLASDAREFLTTVVDARQSILHSHDELDALIAMATPETISWLKCKAALADGAAQQPPYATPRVIFDRLEELAKLHGAWRIRMKRISEDAWRILHAGLLRDLAAARFTTIGAHLKTSAVTARRLLDKHCRLIADDDSYAHRAAVAIQRILRGVYAF